MALLARPALAMLAALLLIAVAHANGDDEEMVDITHQFKVGATAEELGLPEMKEIPGVWDEMVESAKNQGQELGGTGEDSGDSSLEKVCKQCFVLFWFLVAPTL